MSRRNFESVYVVKVACKAMAVFSCDGSDWRNMFGIFINHILIIFDLVFAIPSSIHLYNSSDAGNIPKVLSALFGLFLNFGNYLVFVFWKSELYRKFDQIRELNNESK